MDIHRVIEESWEETKRDFEEAKKTGEALLWTEDTLRLRFLLHLCRHEITIERVLAETKFHIGRKNLQPDIVIDTIEDDIPKKVVFELKYFGKGWKGDWEKLQEYAILGWDYGYFLAVGRSTQCEGFFRQAQKSEFRGHPFETRALVHPTQTLEYASDFKIAGILLKEALPDDVPYIISEEFGDAIGLFEDFVIYFDLSAIEGKCAVWALFYESATNEQRLRSLGLTDWIAFDEKDQLYMSETYTGNILIGIFEANSHRDNANKVKEAVSQFREKIRNF